MNVHHIQLRINALKLTLEELKDGMDRLNQRDKLPTWMTRHTRQIINPAHPSRLRYIVGCEPLPKE